MEPRAGTTADADLVVAALAGDRQAFAGIYDRYADAVFTLCAHLLGDRDDAADACGDVFLVAAERLGQLRDPSRLRPWLFAIARRRVYLRTSRRTRTVPVEEVSDVSAADPLVDPAPVETAVEGAELAAVVREAAAGLEDGDRTVLELQLQGLDGSDLADALGVSPTNAYQASHRMKGRLERSLGALLVARQGREDCPELDRVLADWDGRFSVLWRKRVARHVDGCATCERRRRAVPALLLEGVAAASPVLAVPVSVRRRVLAGATVGAGADAGGRWRTDGFPPPDGIGAGGRRLRVAAALVLLVAGTAAVAWWLVDRGDEVVAAGPSATSTDRPSTTTEAPPTDPVPTAPAAPTTPPPTTSTTAVPATTTVPATTVPPAPRPPATSAPPSDTADPVVELSGPSGRPCGGSRQPFTATVVDASAVASVVLEWSTGAGSAGEIAMADTGSGWTAVFTPQSWEPPYTFRAVATDAAGNVGSSAALTCPV